MTKRPLNTDLNSDLDAVLGSELVKLLTSYETRRLKADLKKGIDVRDSPIVKRIVEKNKIDAIHPAKKRKTEAIQADYLDESDDSDDSFDSHEFDDFISDSEENSVRKFNHHHKDDCIDMDRVISAKFSEDDTSWFNKNIKRMRLLNGIDRFNLEDTIEKKYNFLIALQKAGIYDPKKLDRDIVQEILDSKHSNSVKTILINKIQLALNTEEYQKELNWIDTVLCIPTEIKSSNLGISTIMNNLYKKLSTNMYGMETTIREILQAVCLILTDPNSNGHILTLVGAPGVGKTSISGMIAEIIGMGFGQISCGSINDQAVLTGHSSTYIGSKPGVITQCLINSGQLNNVILLDEMNMIPDSKIVPVLLHILDKSQNFRFKDAFCPEIPIDLSKNLFIISVNSIDGLDKALKDRLKIVHVSGYNVDQKTQICCRHIIPNLNKKTNLNLSIDESVANKCVKFMSNSVSGVRDIERFFSDIYEKLLLIKYVNADIFGFPDISVHKLKKLDIKLINDLLKTDIK